MILLGLLVKNWNNYNRFCLCLVLSVLCGNRCACMLHINGQKWGKSIITIIIINFYLHRTTQARRAFKVLYSESIVVDYTVSKNQNIKLKAKLNKNNNINSNQRKRIK